MLIAQLSDPHIRPQGELYQGLIDSNAMFADAVRQLRDMRPAPDVILLSGDVVDHGAPEEYASARALLADLPTPVLAIPGNHDDRAAFRAAFADHVYLPTDGALHFVVDDLGPLRLIGWDITVPGKHHGDCDDAVMAWLEAALAREPDRPTLIMMHHPPFASGIICIDAYMCERGERLAALVARYPAVERIVCGHIHRHMQLRFGGTVLCTAPSTTTAIALNLTDDPTPASYVEPPAFLLHQWRPETGLITHFVPIGDFRGPLPFA